MNSEPSPASWLVTAIRTSNVDKKQASLSHCYRSPKLLTLIQTLHDNRSCHLLPAGNCRWLNLKPSPSLAIQWERARQKLVEIIAILKGIKQLQLMLLQEGQ